MDHDSSLSPAPRTRKRAKWRIVPLVLVAFFMLVATASAHNEAATASCTATGNSVVLNWTNFANPPGTNNGGENTPDWSITYTPTGGSAITLTGSVTFPDGSYTTTVSIPSAAAAVVATSSWQPSQTSDDSGAETYTNDLSVPSCVDTTTAIATTAEPSSTTAGSPIYDAAVLSGGRAAPEAPTGTITFSLYAASDTSCSTALKTVSVPVNGNGTYDSPDVTETNAGTYQWVASYSGDANNAAAAELCGQTSEQTTLSCTTGSPPTCTTPSCTPPVCCTTGSPPTCTTPSCTPPVCCTTGTPPSCTPATPSITTKASPTGNIKDVSKKAPAEISDSAVLSGGDSPTGKITFALYDVGVGTPSCSSAPKYTDTVTVNKGNATYSTPTIPWTEIGTFQWVATYSGDTNNTTAADACADPAESFTTLIKPGPQCGSKIVLIGRFGQTVNHVFTARVPSRGIKRVTFYLDGVKLKTVTKSHGGFFTIKINLAYTAYRMHTVTALAVQTVQPCKNIARKGSFVHGYGGT